MGIWNEETIVQPTAPTTPKSDVVGSWGIQRSLKLDRECADFYLQEYLDYFEVEGMDRRLSAHVDRLVDQFSRYSDMVVGGELRYSKRFCKMGALPKPIGHAIWRTSRLPRGSRHVAWDGWRFLRQRYGTLAIRWAMDSFRAGGWGGGYGGEAWAKIAETLWRYEVGVYSPKVFVDHCFSLQHNNGSYFNKIWPLSMLDRLDYLLTAKQDGDTATLLESASPDMVACYEAYQEGAESE